jgi:uncharacterized phage-associated protein
MILGPGFDSRRLHHYALKLKEGVMDVLDLAAYLLSVRGPMETMKLQKLVYYAQAWHLAIEKRPLFDDEEEAWAYGPVVYRLYEKHRRCLVLKQVPDGDPNRVDGTPKRSLAVMRAVWDHYGLMSGTWLSRMTHEEAPWRQAREGIVLGGSSRRVITKQAMQSFYAQQERPFDMQPG